MGWWVVAVVGALLLGVGVSADSAEFRANPQGTVLEIIDGDTVLVDISGAPTRLGLLGAAAPAPEGVAGPGQCLAAEATAFLRQQLPLGTQVGVVRFDRQRGGTSPAVLSSDGRLVNVEVVRAGFAAPMVGEVADEALASDLVAARHQAERVEAALHSAEPECTLGARVSALAAAAGQVTPAQSLQGMAAIEARLAELEGLAGRVADVLAVLSGNRGEMPLAIHSAEVVDSWYSQVSELAASATDQIAAVEEALAAEVEAQRRAVEQAAQQRKAAEEAAREAAEQRASAQRGRVADASDPSGETPTPSGGGDPGSPGTSQPVSGPGMDDSEMALLRATNAARAVGRTCGSYGYFPAAAPLGGSGQLADAAQRHADDMASGAFVSHTGSDGSRVGDRINRTGYSWSWSAENIAGGQATPSAAIQELLASPVHCSNIMDARLSEIGIGYRYRAGTTYGHHWVQVFAAPR